MGTRSQASGSSETESRAKANETQQAERAEAERKRRAEEERRHRAAEQSAQEDRRRREEAESLRRAAEQAASEERQRRPAEEAMRHQARIRRLLRVGTISLIAIPILLFSIMKLVAFGNPYPSERPRNAITTGLPPHASVVDSQASAVNAPLRPPTFHCLPQGMQWPSGMPAMLGGTAPAGSKVQVFDDDRLVGDTVGRSDGKWSLPLPALPFGDHFLTLRAFRPDGALLGESVPTKVTVVGLGTPTIAVKPAATTAGAPVVAAPPTPKPSLGIGSTMISDRGGMTLVWVPAGEFTMGSGAADAAAQANEKPQHTVNVGGFWMSRTEVTNAQYAR